MVTREEKCFIGLATACLISLIFGITSLSLTLVKDTDSDGVPITESTNGLTTGLTSSSTTAPTSGTTTGSEATDRIRDFLQRIPNVDFNEVRSFQRTVLF